MQPEELNADCPVCLEPLACVAVSKHPCGHLLCTSCFELGSSLAEKDATVDMSTCVQCRHKSYVRTRNGSSLIEHLPKRKSRPHRRERPHRSKNVCTAAESAAETVVLSPSNPRGAFNPSVSAASYIKRHLAVMILTPMNTPLSATLRTREQLGTGHPQQIAKLRYDSLVHGGKWLGSEYASDLWEPLSSKFLYRNFEPWFIKECRNREGRCVKVPAGSSEERPAQLPLVHGLNGIGHAGLATHAPPPEVEFEQGKASSCVFSAAASALHFIGDLKGAALLGGLLAASAKDIDPMHMLVVTLRNQTLWHVEGVSESTFDIFRSTQTPFCIQIRCSDGAVNHTIVTVGDWVFDSNEVHALPLCQESLDRCAGDGATFVGCVRVLKFEPNKKLVNALAKKRKRVD